MGANQPLRIGKLRDNKRGRGWRAKLYEPTASYPYSRVKFKDPGTNKWVDRPVPPDEDPDTHFDKIEAALDERVVQHARRSTDAPNMRDLAARYIRWLEGKGLDDEHIHNRRNLLEVWVLRGSGDLLVQNWNTEHTQEWITACRNAGISPARVEDLGATLAGMRNAAQRKSSEDNTRWLSPAENPLEGISYSRKSTVQSAHRDYVPVAKRPTTAAAESLIARAEADPYWDWFPTQLRVGVFCGLRLSEQLALRDVDVDLVRRELRVWTSMRWPHPMRGIDWGIKATKTRHRRTVPYPQSLHEPLLALCRSRLGLPDTATVEEVTAAQVKHYEAHLQDLDEKVQTTRRARTVTRHDHFLFSYGHDGRPPTKEQYGDQWRKLRAESDWPDRIPWRNARHHAATWWRAVVVKPSGASIPWETIAAWLGNTVMTCENHYVLPGEDDEEFARGVLDLL